MAASGEKLKETDISRDEFEKISEALKNEEFRKLFVEYAKEIEDPENKKKYESDIAAMEAERGYKAEFIHPTPGFVVKTTQFGSPSDIKCFINVCKSDKVARPSSTPRKSGKKSGTQWSIPHLLVPPRDDVDKSGTVCVVYDIAFHPDAHALIELDHRFKQTLVDTAMDGVANNFRVRLNKRDLRYPRMAFKGVPKSTVIRTKDPAFEPPTAAPQSPPKPNNTGTDTNKPLTPKFSIKHRGYFDLQSYAGTPRTRGVESRAPTELVVDVELPLLDSASSVSLDVFPKKILLESPSLYRAAIDLPYCVDDSLGKAKFDKSKRVLSVTLPVLWGSKEEVVGHGVGGDVEGKPDGKTNEVRKANEPRSAEDAFQTDVDESRAGVDESRTGVDESRIEVDESWTEVDESLSEVDKSRTEVDESLTEVDMSRTKVDESQTEVDESRTEVDESRTEVDESRTEVNESRTEVDKSRTEVDESRTEVDESRTEVDESRTEVDESRTEVDESRTQVDVEEVPEIRDASLTASSYWEEKGLNSNPLDIRNNSKLVDAIDAIVEQAIDSSRPTETQSTDVESHSISVSKEITSIPTPTSSKQTLDRSLPRYKVQQTNNILVVVLQQSGIDESSLVHKTLRGKSGYHMLFECVGGPINGVSVPSNEVSVPSNGVSVPSNGVSVPSNGPVVHSYSLYIRTVNGSGLQFEDDCLEMEVCERSAVCVTRKSRDSRGVWPTVLVGTHRGNATPVVLDAGWGLRQGLDELYDEDASVEERSESGKVAEGGGFVVEFGEGIPSPPGLRIDIPAVNRRKEFDVSGLKSTAFSPLQCSESSPRTPNSDYSGSSNSPYGSCSPSSPATRWSFDQASPPASLLSSSLPASCHSLLRRHSEVAQQRKSVSFNEEVDVVMWRSPRNKGSRGGKRGGNRGGSPRGKGGSSPQGGDRGAMVIRRIGSLTGGSKLPVGEAKRKQKVAGNSSYPGNNKSVGGIESNIVCGHNEIANRNSTGDNESANRNVVGDDESPNRNSLGENESANRASGDNKPANRASGDNERFEVLNPENVEQHRTKSAVSLSQDLVFDLD